MAKGSSASALLMYGKCEYFSRSTKCNRREVILLRKVLHSGGAVYSCTLLG